VIPYPNVAPNPPERQDNEDRRGQHDLPVAADGVDEFVATDVASLTGSL